MYSRVVLLALILGSNWETSLAQFKIDNALAVLGESDAYLKKFQTAMSNRDHDQSIIFYEKMESYIPKLVTAINDTSHVETSVRRFNIFIHMVNMQLKMVLFKIRKAVKFWDLNFKVENPHPPPSKQVDEINPIKKIAARLAEGNPTLQIGSNWGAKRNPSPIHWLVKGKLSSKPSEHVDSPGSTSQKASYESSSSESHEFTTPQGIRGSSTGSNEKPSVGTLKSNNQMASSESSSAESHERSASHILGLITGSHGKTGKRTDAVQSKTSKIPSLFELYSQQSVETNPLPSNRPNRETWSKNWNKKILSSQRARSGLPDSGLPDSSSSESSQESLESPAFQKHETRIANRSRGRNWIN